MKNIKMGKRKFEITVICTAVVELDDSVIDVVDDEWRAALYDLNTPEEIAEHVGINLIRGRRLCYMDGWADQPDENAKLTYSDWQIEECYEIKK